MWRLKYPQLQQGLVGAWCPSRDRFRGSSQLTDQSTAKNHGTLTNMDAATDWVISPGAGGGYALDFDGSNDYVPLNTYLALLHGTGSQSMAFWGYRRASNAVLVIGQDAAPIYNNVAAWYDGKVYFQISPYSGQDYSAASNIVGWAHYAMTFRSGTITGYINGVQVVSGTGPSTVPTNVTQLWNIGKYNANLSYANGLIDDVLVSSRCWTPSEILLLSKRRGIAYEMEYVPIVKAGSAPPAASSLSPSLIHSFALPRSTNY